MVKIFVDDVLPLARFPGSGMVLKGGNLVWDAEQAGKDVGVEPDVITARLLVSIANSIENESDILIYRQARGVNFLVLYDNIKCP